MAKKSLYARDRGPDADALSVLIHDTNQTLAGLRSVVRELQEKEGTASMVSRLKHVEKKICGLQDDYYKKWENNFGIKDS